MGSRVRISGEARFSKKFRDGLGLAGILILGASLRFASWGSFEFKGDEVGVLRLARRIVEGTELPTAGHITSVGFLDGYLMPYLWAPTILFGKEPTLTYAAAILLSLLAVPATFFFAKRFWNSPVAFIASLSFAASPWAVLYGRKIWTQNLPLLQVLILAVVYLWVVERRRWALTLFPVLIVLQIQAHLMALILLPAVAVTLWIFRSRIEWKPLGLGLALGAAVSLPYFGYLVRNWGSIFEAVSRSPLRGGLILDLQPFYFLLSMVTGRDIAAGLGGASHLFEPYNTGLLVVHWAAALGIGVGLLTAAWQVWRRRPERDSALLLLIWLLAPLLPLIIHTAPLHRHYVMSLYPLQFVAIGIAVDRLAVPREWRKRAAIVVLGTLVAFQVVSTVAFYGYFDRYGALGGYGLSYRHWRTIVDKTDRWAGATGSDQVAVLTWGTDTRSEVAPAVIDYLRAPDQDLVWLGRGATSSVLFSSHRDRLYLLTRDVPEVEQELSARGRLLERQELAEEISVALYSLPSETPEFDRGRPEVQVDVLFDNGVRFVGYDSPVVDAQKMELLTHWSFEEVDEADRRAHWQVFVHLLDAEEHRWAQRDAFGLDSEAWENGDVLLQWYEFPLPAEMPPGQYWLLVGFYSLLDGHRSSVAGSGALADSDAISLGPFSL